VVPINPRYGEVEGLACLPSLGDAGPVDLVVLAVANESLEEQTSAAINSGARSLAVFASCGGLASDGTPLVDRIADLARRATIPVCGGNGLGFVNLERRLRICGFTQPANLVDGCVTFLTHSGSLFSAMLHDVRRLRFNLVVSTGNEMVTTMDSYLAYALAQPSTKTIGLFVETVRNVEGMRDALVQAASLDIPVVALKVGRTEQAQRSVATHSSALAGEYGAFTAFAAAHGVHLVDSMDEMADTLEIFAAPRRAVPGGLGSVHDSGGERSMLMDVADRIGVPLAVVSDQTREVLRGILDPGLEAENPVDGWGTGRGANDVFAGALRAIAADEAVGVVAFAVDLTAEENPEEGYSRVPIDLLDQTNKPVVILANLAGSVDPIAAADLRNAGVPVLHGSETGLRAIRHLLEHRDLRPVVGAPPDPPPQSLSKWQQRLSEARMLDDSEAFALLADFGVPMTAYAITRSLSDTMSAADTLGYPVALKITGVAHKSEAGGVIVGISGRADLIHAWEALSPLSGDLVVQPMAPSGVELALGVVADPQFGPILVLAAGGILAELVGDRVTAQPPINHQRALTLLSQLKVSKFLDGLRGKGAADISAVARAIVGLSNLAFHLRDDIDSIDVNPLIAHPGGCVAVDALVVNRPRIIV
jgi:acyl-CoA synthetase (NDP forming)